MVLAALTLLATAGLSDAAQAAGSPTITGMSPSDGQVKGNTKVQIHGTNFTGATAVDFGASASPKFTVEKANEIIAYSPPGVETVDVTVTTPEGMSAITPQDQFTYLGKPPAISGLSPTKAPAAGGTTVTVKGVNFRGVSAVMFGSIPAESFVLVSESAITAVSPPGAVGPVYVHVTTPYGTSNNEFCAVNMPCSTKNIFRYTTPTLTSVTPANGPAAGGTPVTARGTGFALGGLETTFKFGGALATSVECLSFDECTMLTPAHKKGLQAVIVTVGGAKNATSTAPRFDFE
jgi:hypothetical protein